MTRRRKDYSIAVRMYNAGNSIQECAEAYGITRQAMWKILLRRGVVMRPKEKYSEGNHFYRGGALHDHGATNKVTKAKKAGKLIPQPCEECGYNGMCVDGRSKVHAHHEDYNKPMEVRWLCQSCHHEWHKHNTAKAKEKS